MCGIIGFIDRTKSRIDGSSIKAALSLMNERGSGYGAGYAAYGIYPEYADYYALHVFFDNLAEPKRRLTKSFNSGERSFIRKRSQLLHSLI